MKTWFSGLTHYDGQGPLFTFVLTHCAWKIVKEYFDQPINVKELIKMTPSYPYGYEANEKLSKSFDSNNNEFTYADMKETFAFCFKED